MRAPAHLLLALLAALSCAALVGCAPVLRSVTPARAAALDLSGPAPDVVVLGIGGHCAAPCRAPRDNLDSLSGRGVLDAVAGPLGAQGLRVQVAGYASHVAASFTSPFVASPQRGYLGLLTDVRRIQAVWGSGQPVRTAPGQIPGPALAQPARRPPRLVLIGHSQGAVWSHLLTRATPDVSYAVQIDLDGICTNWSADFQDVTRTHAAELAAHDSPSPLEACAVMRTAAGPRQAKDIVWPNVERNLEVQSKHYPSRVGPGGGSPLSYLFDRVTNIRLDGTRSGVTRFVSPRDDHSAVTNPGGDSMTWVTGQLGAVARAWKAQDVGTAP